MLVMIRSAGSHLSTPQHWPVMPVTRVLVALPLLLAIQVDKGMKSIAKQQNYGIYFSLYILVCLILYLLWESPSIITRDVKPEMLIPFCRQSIGRREVKDQLLSGVGFNTTDSCKCGVKPPTPDALKPEAIVGGDVAEVTLMTFWWCGFWWWWFWWYW